MVVEAVAVVLVVEVEVVVEVVEVVVGVTVGGSQEEPEMMQRNVFVTVQFEEPGE